MYSPQKLLEMIASENATLRYDACEWLRLSPESSPEIILALQKATHDSDIGVASRAAHAMEANVHQQMMMKMGLVTPQSIDQTPDEAPLTGFETAQGQPSGSLPEVEMPARSLKPVSTRPSARNIILRSIWVIIIIAAGVIYRLTGTKSEPSVDYNNKGLEYLDKGDLVQALTNFNQAIQLDPKEAVLYFNRGCAYSEQGDYDRAISDFDKAIQLGDDSAEVYNRRGVAYYFKGEFDKAIADFDRSIQKNSNTAETYYNRGLSYLYKEEYDLAIDDFDQAVKLNPKYADAYIDRGSAYYEKGNRSYAINDYTKAIQINPNDPYPYVNRGLVYGEQGDLERAINDFNQAITLDAKDPYTYYYRGAAYSTSGDNSNASADLNKALEMCGDNTELCQWIQEELDKLGNE